MVTALGAIAELERGSIRADCEEGGKSPVRQHECGAPAAAARKVA